MTIELNYYPVFQLRVNRGHSVKWRSGRLKAAGQVHMHLIMTTDLNTRLQAACEQNQVSRQDFIAQAIEFCLSSLEIKVPEKPHA